ncbi:MAG: Zn-ribbon domain-containing OB-fold protein [Nitrososphaerota archaeon]|nr:Zn-ribbon domain-containing OB-fold protein [Nitrososphaerota archaeon]
MSCTTFERFGKISYTAESKAKRFVDFLDAGKVMGTRCTRCKKVYFPPKMDCTNCLTSDSMTWVEMPGPWTLLTYTKAHFAPTGFEGDTPYVIGVAESVGGHRLLARVATSVDDERLGPGMKLELRVARLDGGKLAYEFSPSGVDS